jgi:repressor LexA|tara:strand:+ start:196 stop:795 length:600 start_codon:yes stop_codon:yes gene_type:complete
MPRTPVGETRAKIHEFVRARILRGAPPSIREVRDAFGFKSSATAREHLDALVTAGALEQEAGKDRGYRLPGAFVPGMAPIIGRVQAGAPHEAIELAEGYVAIDPAFAESTFALIVRGESMSGREIHDGDIVLVRRDLPVREGDVVVALLGEEATVKTYASVSGRVRLRAENPAYDDIEPRPDGDEFRILGRVVEVRRAL